ncbi:MAG: hypothetical protein K1Y01_04075 [Vicinamibacteria bacterium]|nr:hypothetical protein [Vicinamibacteria bacterium]
MTKVLAVALLDVRRLSFGIASGALVAGLVPALASGLGGKVEIGAVAAVAFLVVGLAAGGAFGADFADGKSSFFFARPLPAGVLIGGRFAALLALAAAAFFSLMASSWISSSDRSGWNPSVLTRFHAELLLSAWALSLFVSLAVAARGRGVRVDGGTRAMLMIPVRLALSMGAFLLVFGLFADLVLRAYFQDSVPVRIFLLSWVAASLVASCLAIAGGRTERGRISRYQGRVMTAHFALVAVVVAAAWTWVLHPGVQAIQRVNTWTWGSSDGRTAYVRAEVDRGDSRTFTPVFVLDVASGQTRRLDADAYQGPWVSADGGTVVWSEATPFFFRPLWRRLGGTTTYRVRTASGDIAPLPMPGKLPDYRSVRDLSNFGAIDWVLPSPDGDVFAIQWNRHLSFTSRSRGELSEIDEWKDRAGLSRGINLQEAAFLPSGELRATRVVRDAGGGQSLAFIDIDPKTASVKTLVSIPADGSLRVQFDLKATRALVTSVTRPGRGALIALIDLSTATDAPKPTVLLKDVLFPQAAFLADGRIAVSNGGSVGAGQKQALKTFSPAGQALLDIPIGEGMAPRLGREMFPGILGASTGTFTDELSLVDCNSGAVLRRLPGLNSPGWFLRNPAPPGTPAAQILLSREGKLYELPSPSAELRLLLPRS